MKKIIPLLTLVLFLSVSCKKTDPVKVILGSYEGEYELVNIQLTDYDSAIDLDNDGQAAAEIIDEITKLVNYKAQPSLFQLNGSLSRSGDFMIKIPSQIILADGDAPFTADSPISTYAANQYMFLFVVAHLRIDEDLAEVWSADPLVAPDGERNLNRALAFDPEIVSADKDIIVLKLGNAVFYDFKTASLIQSGAVYTFKHDRK